MFSVKKAYHGISLLQKYLRRLAVTVVQRVWTPSSSTGTHCTHCTQEGRTSRCSSFIISHPSVSLYNPSWSSTMPTRTRLIIDLHTYASSQRTKRQRWVLLYTHVGGERESAALWVACLLSAIASSRDTVMRSSLNNFTMICCLPHVQYFVSKYNGELLSNYWWWATMQ